MSRPRAFRALSPLAILSVLSALLLAGEALAAKPPADDDCLTCHGEKSAARSNGKSVFTNKEALAASIHGQAGASCVDCHADLAKASLPHRDKLKKVSCAGCHDGVAAKHPFHPSMAADPEAVPCQDCHGGHDVGKAKESGARIHKACAECHAEVVASFSTSAHGKAAAAGKKEAPTCVSCHSHPVTAAPAGATKAEVKRAQEKLCLACHLDSPEVKALVGPSAGFIAAYEKSVHGAALLKGNEKAANCVDCHGAHVVQPGSNENARVNRAHIVADCGKCHVEIAKHFAESIHGTSVAKGNKESPTCTTCHGEHGILKHTDPNSPVAAANVSARVCTPCHASLRLTEKYGISNDRFQTFESSFHGLAVRGGSVEVANCASCHSSHDIKPSTDPTSRIAKKNLPKTCGQCHPGANARFTAGSIHLAGTKKTDPLIYWISYLYIGLIIATIGGMAGHNLLDFVKKSKRKLAIRRGELEEEHAGHRLYLRMTLEERLQHGSLLISFFLLVVTGFMLRFPESWWVIGIRGIWRKAFDLRSFVHRFAGVWMVLASCYHLYYITFTARGRQLIKDLWPVLQDARDAIAVVRYNLNLSFEKPKLGRFSYVEKAEYWALIWGNVVMAGTGFIMWFDNTFLNLIGKLGYDVARTVHFYEAVLATLAILVWHIYFVIFNPDAYPMNTAWLTGTVSEREMMEEHPLELAAVREKEAAEADAAEKGRGKG